MFVTAGKVSCLAQDYASVCYVKTIKLMRTLVMDIQNLKFSVYIFKCVQDIKKCQCYAHIWAEWQSKKIAELEKKMLNTKFKTLKFPHVIRRDLKVIEAILHAKLEKKLFFPPFEAMSFLVCKIHIVATILKFFVRFTLSFPCNSKKITNYIKLP